MKGRAIVLDMPDGCPAAALWVDGRLEDLRLAPRHGPRPPEAGQTVTGRVTRKLPKAGAFCALDGGDEGYLRDARGVVTGDRLLAQVVSLPEPGKAVTLTTRLLFKGPRLILTPGAPGVNVSRRIGNTAERARLEAAVTEALQAAAGGDAPGVILRTAARDEAAADLDRELRWLLHDWAAACALSQGDAPDTALDPLFRAALGDWAFPLPDEILAPPPLARTLRRADPALGAAAFWGDARLLARLRAEAAPFEASGVADALAGLAGSLVALPDATMSIEPTRALVAVDVNTGRDHSPAAALKANLAAIRDLPRQLRLRGLGGQIAVDFAPVPKQNRRVLEEALQKAFRADPIETALAGWTPLGLFELQRKRERRPLTEALDP